MEYEIKENPAARHLVCGVDECGIGSAIAEVYVAACILDPANPISGLNDSKKLSAKRRAELSKEIQAKAIAFQIATASLEEIERLNVLYASHLAMVRAIEGMKVKPSIVLIDGDKVPVGLTLPEDFFAERDRRKDWNDWRGRDNRKLLRSKVAKTCKFARSVLRQNPAVQKLLGRVETQLRMMGILAEQIHRRDGNNSDARSGIADKPQFLTRLTALEASIKEVKRSLEHFENARTTVCSETTSV